MSDRRADDSPGGSAREHEPKLRWLQVAVSAAAAAFGVQSRAKRERDFEHGRPAHFIIAGIVFTTLFVLAIVLVVVRLVLTGAG